ncbi:MAG: hypothetical protein OXB96_01775 [Candidatus Kaiserbacteria bacterium]|nr:hypothetical protein [Candidatus Kaiserbacteria bacterium]
MLIFSYGTVFADTANESSALQEVNRVLNLFDSFSVVIEVLIVIVTILVFLYFFWGLVEYIRKNDATLEEAKKKIAWGVLGIFVLVSMWGLIYSLRISVLGSKDTPDPNIEFRKVESL